MYADLEMRPLFSSIRATRDSGRDRHTGVLWSDWARSEAILYSRLLICLVCLISGLFHFHPQKWKPVKANAKILTELARSQKALSRYELVDQTRLRPDTVYYDWIPKMVKWGWVDKEVDAERYSITTRGLLHALKLNPALRRDSDLLHRSGYAEYENNVRIRTGKQLERMIETIREVHQTGKAAPGWYLLFESWADETGEVKSRIGSAQGLICASCGAVDPRMARRRRRRLKPLWSRVARELRYSPRRKQSFCERCAEQIQRLPFSEKQQLPLS